MSLRIAAIVLLLLGVRAAGAAPVGLSIVSGSGTVLIGSGAARYEFGTRRLSDETPLAHTFFLRNPAKTPLTIDRVEASCDCVQAEVGETPSLPVIVAPGQTVPVRVTVSTRRLLPGSVSKSVWIYRRGAGNAGLRLEMHGTVRDELTNSPVKAKGKTP